MPASKCPWCGKQIMVICANCKAYADDQKSHCEHCGAPLVADHMERIALLARHPEVAHLVEDQEHARLVASTVVAGHLAHFFFDDSQGQRTVLVEFVGSVNDPTSVAAGVLLAAYAYVCQNGYCALRLIPGLEDVDSRIEIALLHPWDGQRCLEGALVAQADRALTTREATERVLHDLMSFRVMTVPGGSRGRTRTLSAPERSALAAIDQAARLTALPEHDRQEACRESYRVLAEFVEADRSRARVLAVETIEMLDMFARRETGPSFGAVQ